MTNKAFQLATRHRLGLPDSLSLALSQCTCPKKTKFIDDPSHLHTCLIHKSLPVTIRHNNLVHTLVELAHMVGYHCIVEPNLHRRPPHINQDQEEHYNKHADILLLKGDEKIYVDVTVTCTTQESNLGVKAIRTVPGHSLKSKAQDQAQAL